jgi:hypothetical protein
MAERSDFDRSRAGDQTEVDEPPAADRGPTEEEIYAAEEAAGESIELLRGAGLHFEEMSRAGAALRGEGEVR